MVTPTVTVPQPTPTATDPEALLDDFLCYRVKRTKGTPKFAPVLGVRLVDQFDDVTFDVKARKNLCTPADKNGTGILDPATHLERDRIKAVRGTPKHVRQTGLRIVNQLGELFVDTVKPELLLVPTAKSLIGPPPPPDPADHDVDHFTCYKVKVTKDTPKFPKGVQVTVGDQFTSPGKVFDLKKPTRLCAPAEKNGEPVQNPAVHLLCYAVKPAKGAPKHEKRTGVFTANQFGDATLDTLREHELCVPSLKNP